MPVAGIAAAGPGGAGAGSAPEAVALPVRPGPSVVPHRGVLLDPTTGGSIPVPDLDRLLARERMTGEAGQLLAVPLAGGGPRLLLLVGVGDASPGSLRRAGAAIARRARTVDSVLCTLLVGADEWVAEAFVEALLLGGYELAGKARPTPSRLSTIALLAEPALAAPVARGVVTARAVALARDLVNTPSLEKDPAWLAGQAEAVAGRSGLGLTVRAPEQLAAEGFGGLLAVGMGSPRGPRLIELTYCPAGVSRHVVLVGKGITFDSGGLSLKRGPAMAAMKTDMAGGAAVIATMSALAELGVRHRVTGLVAAAENMPSGAAQRPGDVIHPYGGRTVEVLNTDAEGRLVLADALAYARHRLAPTAVVDLATLTGAMTLGLGRTHAGLFSNDDELATGLGLAGQAAGERVWRMPLVEDYRDALDSPVADLANVGDPARHYGGGAIVAALFLREFVGEATPWAHLDIAGPARSEVDDAELTKGGTGFGVRLLLRWLAAAQAGGRRAGRPGQSGRPAAARSARRTTAKSAADHS